MLNDLKFPKEQQVKLAQAFIPYQQYSNLLPIEEALFKGTIFADLYRPYRNPIIRRTSK